MSLTEITNKVYELGNAWEEFKSSNDQKLDELKKTNSFDSLHTKKLERINKELDSCKEQITNLEIAAKRPLFGGIEDKDIKSKRETKQFINYMRTGELNIEQKALSTSTPPDGYALLMPEMADYIASKIYDSSPMRQICSSQSISTDMLKINSQIGSMETKWVGRSIVAAETETPTFDTITIYTHLLYSQPKAEQRLIQDTVINLEKWITERLIHAFSYAENKAFIDGDGSTMPRGILSYSSNDIEQLKSGVDGEITLDTLINMYYSLRDEYTANASYLMNKAGIQEIRLLKDAQDRYVWQPGLMYGTPDMLLGVPVYSADHMPRPALNKLAVALADFKKAYLIVDRIGMDMLRDPLTEKPFIKFYTTKRVGGAVVNHDAIKLLKLAA